MQFIKLRQVPIPATVDTLLQRFAKVRGIRPEEAAAICINHYLVTDGEQLARIHEARAALEAHRRDHPEEQTRFNAHRHGSGRTA